MSTPEFSAPGLGAGINSQIESNRAKPLVLRNSRILCWFTMSGSFFAAILGVWMGFMVVSLLFFQGGAIAGRATSALEWGVRALATAYICPQLWSLGRAMLGYRVHLDSTGVTFNLGTEKKPADLSMPWDQVDAIKYKRVCNVQRCSVHGSDGSQATFSSYTFFRPKKIVRMIADRTGLAIEEA